MIERGERYEYVLDSSALLAAMMGEPGAERVLSIIDQAVISTVNLLEVFGKLIQMGVPVGRAKHTLDSIALPAINWSAADVWDSADLVPLAWTHGLSLGDRICLATARKLQATAVTTDRAWAKLTPSPNILLIR